jgi:prepilin-type N-terminal cleavage/methylation domain-containing protein
MIMTRYVTLERASSGMNKLNKHQTPSKGFTIVELLVVVVIIAILAAITVVAYSSMQTRAKNSAAQTTLNTFSKKVQAYYQLKGSYPATTTSGAFMSNLGTYPESRMPTSGLAISNATLTGTNGTNTIRVSLCGTGAGVKLTPYDYTTGAESSTVTNLGDVTGTCTAAIP